MVAIVAAVSFLSTSIYKATSLILIEEQSPKVVNVQEVVSPDLRDTEYYLTEYNLLQSRSFALQAINELGLREHLVAEKKMVFYLSYWNS